MPGQSIAFGGDSNFSQMQPDDSVTAAPNPSFIWLCFVSNLFLWRQNQLNPNASIFNVYGGGSGRDANEYADMDSRGGRGSSKDNSQFGMVDKDGFQMQSTRMCRVIHSGCSCAEYCAQRWHYFLAQLALHLFVVLGYRNQRGSGRGGMNSGMRSSRGSGGNYRGGRGGGSYGDRTRGGGYQQNGRVGGGQGRGGKLKRGSYSSSSVIFYRFLNVCFWCQVVVDPEEVVDLAEAEAIKVKVTACDRRLVNNCDSVVCFLLSLPLTCVASARGSRCALWCHQSSCLFSKSASIRKTSPFHIITSQ